MRKYYPGDVVLFAIPVGMGDIKAVTLSRGRVCHFVRFAVDEDAGVIKVGPLRRSLCAGVYKITVKTSCGCHATDISLVCRGPQLAYDQKYCAYPTGE